MGEGTKVEPLPGMEAVDEVTEAELRAEAARQAFEVRWGESAWMDEYFGLLAEGWRWRQAAYIVWASQPKKARSPGTQEELAEILGLASGRAIRKWREKNPAIDQRVHELTASVLMKSRAEVFAALVAAASNESPRAATDRKLFLEMSGDYQRETRVRVGELMEDDLAEVDVEKLRALARNPAAAGGGDE